MQYFVEGRQEIVWDQEISVQKGTRLVGRGESPTLVVSAPSRSGYMAIGRFCP